MGSAFVNFDHIYNDQLGVEEFFMEQKLTFHLFLLNQF
jgi:hypothetical protein